MTHRVLGPPIAIRRRQITADDAEMATAGLARLWGEVRLEVPVGFEWHVEVAELGPLSIVQGACTTRARLALVPHAHSIVLPTGTGARVESGTEHADLVSLSDAVVGSAGTPVEVHFPGPIRSFNARLDPAFLAAHFEALTGEPLRDPLVFGLRMPPATGAYIERLCRFLFSESAVGDPVSHPPVLAGLLESLASALLTSAPHSHSALLESGVPPSSRSVVRRVEEFLDEHAAEPITTSDLASIAGVPLRAVESAFREHRKTSPAAHLLSRRIHRARRMLQSTPPAPVPGVASACGFARVETFAATYFRAFGERPEDTRHRALLATGAPPAPVEVEAGSPDRLSRLSPREHEVCALVVRGMLNKQVAAELRLSERTVKEYRAHAMAKLGVTSLAELVGLFRTAAGSAPD